MLEKPTTVTWFTPSRMAAGAATIAPTHEQHIGHTGDYGESTLSPDSMLTPVLNPHTMPVTSILPPSHTHHPGTHIIHSHPWSVYGPAFNRLYSSKKRLHRRRQNQPLNPSDDSSYSSLDDSDSALDDEDSLSAEGWSNLTYAEMPLELLGTIFQQFMYVPRESLDRLAQERNRARINASMQDFSTLSPQATWQGPFHGHHCQTGCGSFWLGHPSSGGVQHLPGHRAASDTSSSSSHSRRTSMHLSSSTATDPDIDYDGEDDELTEVDSDSGDETRGKAWDAAGMLAHKMSGLAMDAPRVNNIEEEDSGSTSSGSHDIGYGYRNDSATDTLTDEDDFEGSVDGAARSASRSPTIVPSTMSSGGSPKTFFHSGLDQVHCHKMCSDTYVPPPVPRHGINRVDNILPEAEMLDELHRDQFFHPTTHTSLHSDLYNCSLVNRQWRIAALQLLWQSVVLDSESCRPEPTDPCSRCTQFQTAKMGRRSTRSMSSASESSTCSSPSSSSSSASSPRTLSPTHDYSPVRRTRLEAMLDSYMELYGLDLAKCVQTVELDLRLLTWPAEGESIKRILRRLSPFTHLRLVWAEEESPEELIAGFRVAMEFLHPQIRHLHFLSGFVISKPWAQEMEKMTRLETITLEQLGSLEVIEYDWQRIRCLRMNAIIPRGIFQYPAAMMLPVQGIEYPVTTYITDETMTVVTTGTSAAQQASDEMISQGAGLQGMGLPTSGWWQWTGLRKIEIRMKNAVLPSEWLQDLTNIIAENALTLCQQYGHANSDPLVVSSGDSSSAMLLGPPLEVLDIDCEVSHPHKDVFALLVHAWGHRLEEFHFTQSDELTDEFFLLCMQKMTRVKKLSLRESKGITGEGLIGIMDMTPEDLSAGKVPIMLRPDFLELNLDQSRIRGDFLKTLRSQCPTAQYNVREVR